VRFGLGIYFEGFCIGSSANNQFLVDDPKLYAWGHPFDFLFV
jgi:hypothetical protein